ncbi:DUF4365 domain-containing protein [Nocardiopsis sinuspersici]|uniref:DUF4365 domain-containing protein n=1 Tax=Nocardiopsis sinuspersici TaxID=501010 RepID=UPI0015CA5619|nr:DUF4365 domain-containing protein [Nocardiopsis sinuspersici]
MKEHFSLAFTRLVAYEAGCSVRQHDTDFDGVDLTIVSSEMDGVVVPQFDLQLKCTAQQNLLRSDHMIWRMKAEPYRKLIQQPRMTPAYLGVLLLPEEGPWLSVSEERLVTPSRMYWQAASELAPLEEGSESVTVRLPRSNLFEREQVRGILQRAAEQLRGMFC